LRPLNTKDVPRGREAATHANGKTKQRRIGVAADSRSLATGRFMRCRNLRNRQEPSRIVIATTKRRVLSKGANRPTGVQRICQLSVRGTVQGANLDDAEADADARTPNDVQPSDDVDVESMSMSM